MKYYVYEWYHWNSLYSDEFKKMCPEANFTQLISEQRQDLWKMYHHYKTLNDPEDRILIHSLKAAYNKLSKKQDDYDKKINQVKNGT